MKIKLFPKPGALISVLTVLCCFTFVACNKDTNDLSPKNEHHLNTSRAFVYMQNFVPSGNEVIGTEVMLTDKRDGITYRCIKMADGQWWMGENLKYNVNGSTFYNNEAENLETYGRLYKWQEAMDAVPENWQVPSDEEWKALEIALGMTSNDADVTGWRNSGYIGTLLKSGGNSGLELLLNGYQHSGGTYFYLSTYGRYWTSTESGANAFDREVYSNKASVYRGTYGKAYRYSVRCILQEREKILYMQDFTPTGNEVIGAEVMLTDKRDNIIYRCIKLADGRWWMGENLKYDLVGSAFYNNDSTNLASYGRLYTWQKALDATPENWNVPTDNEWKILEMALGMTQEDANKENVFRGNDQSTQLQTNGTSGLNLQLSGSGGNNGRFYNLNICGVYWTSSEQINAWSACIRELYNMETRVYRAFYIEDNYLSVRCILQEKEKILYMQDFIPNPADTVGTEVMLTDKRDNIPYRCIKMADGRWWMGENLKYNLASSVFYNNEETNLILYGRMYNWQEAIDAIPENWKMPSDEEWKELEIALGMTPSDANSRGSRSSGMVGEKLKQSGNSKAELLFSGMQYKDGSFSNLDDTGFYWSSTGYNSDNAYFRYVPKLLPGVSREITTKMYRFSVRYILK